MNRHTLGRIFAIIGLVGAVGMAVTVTLYFFNMFGENSGLFGTLALIFVAFTLAFWALAYAMRPKEDGKSDNAPQDVPDGDSSDGLSAPESEAKQGQEDVDARHDVVPGSEGQDGPEDK